MAKIAQAGSANKKVYSLIPTDEYEARLVSFVLIGVQKQRPFKGTPKPDALVAKISYELIGETVTVTDGEGNEETKPAIVFQDVVVPAAGVTRGHMFNLLQATTGDKETYDDTDKYADLIGMPVSLQVGSYTGKQDGVERNGINAVNPIPKKYRDGVEDSTVDTLFFCCYDDSESAKEKYAGLGNFLQGKLAEASDKDFLPCITQEWPTEKPADDDDEKEF